MKTVIIQSYRTFDVADWIARCLATVKPWAASRGYDHWMTGDEAFALCGDDYLAAVGDNKRSITNLCRLELIRQAHTQGYDRAIWFDADVHVFDPERFDIEPTARIGLPRQTWIWKPEQGWGVDVSINNCVVSCMAGDPDLDLIIQATRHRARHHPVTHNFQVGVDLVRGLHRFMEFHVIMNVGMLSPHVLAGIAHGDTQLMGHQARYHQHPIQAANLAASPHVPPVLPEAVTLQAMDILEATRGGVINDPLAGDGAAPA